MSSLCGSAMQVPGCDNRKKGMSLMGMSLKTSVIPYVFLGKLLIYGQNLAWARSKEPGESSIPGNPNKQFMFKAQLNVRTKCKNGQVACGRNSDPAMDQYV